MENNESIKRESFCTKVLNWIKALWPWQKKFDTCKLTNIKSRYITQNIFENINVMRVYNIAQNSKYISSILKECRQQNPEMKRHLLQMKQTLFEMQVLLRVNILNLDGNKAVKTINFPTCNSAEAKNFNPEDLSDENILEVCRKFNEYFLRRTNFKVYQEYKNQIENLENPGRFFASWDPKQFYRLCQNIIKAADFTEQNIKNMEFGSDKNTNHNQQGAIPKLEIKKEKNL